VVASLLFGVGGLDAVLDARDDTETDDAAAFNDDRDTDDDVTVVRDTGGMVANT